MKFITSFYSLVIIFITIEILQKTSCQKTYRMPQEVTEAMASRETRYHHFLWHNIRNQWNLLDGDAREKIRQLGWEPPRPALEYDEDGQAHRLEDNDSGEDFLYMHRQMIADVNNIMKKAGYNKRVVGFKRIPTPDDKDYPVLPTYAFPGIGNLPLNMQIAFYKSDEFYWDQIKPAEDLYTNPDYLRSLTLGQLGSQLEFSIHAWMHMRFSQSVSEVRPGSDETMPYIDEKWDDPSYDWLGDTYSSHVHPLFWKLHGWVDDRVEDWRIANNLTNITWKGTWMGGEGSVHHSLHQDGNNDGDMGSKNHHDNNNRKMKESHHHMDIMEEVIRILLKEVKCSYFYCYDNENYSSHN